MSRDDESWGDIDIVDIKWCVTEGCGVTTKEIPSIVQIDPVNGIAYLF